jgi:hypothetical protein
MPGLLQIPPYTEARIHADRDSYPRTTSGESCSQRLDTARALEARVIRQRVLDRPSGPIYEVIIDEAALRRVAAPADVIAAQLDHLVHVGHDRDKVTIRVLPLAARIAGNAIPRSAFFVYRYPDPGDPVVVAVDTITSDLVLTDQTDPYLTLYERLKDAALPPTDSLDFLGTLSDALTRDPQNPDHGGLIRGRGLG